MKSEDDPVRWSDAPDQVPSALRDAWAAGRKEAPNGLQTKMLALKLAAISAGTAAAVSASTAQSASSTGAGVAGGATAKVGSAVSLAKVVASIALAGATAAGMIAYREPSAVPQATLAEQAARQSSVEAPPARTTDDLSSLARGSARFDATERRVPTAPSAAPRLAGVAQQPTPPPRSALVPPESAARREPAVAVIEPSNAGESTRAQAQATIVKGDPRAVAARSAVHPNAPAVRGTQRAGEVALPSEVALLRAARVALASRPREAFALTEEHRRHYPKGVFTQERDALAIEALMRAGDMDAARDLAQHFVSHYPSSPHAHRLREAMRLP